MLLQVRRWLPDRTLVVVADSSFAAIELLGRVQRLSNPICMVTRFRLDAALYEPAPTRKPGQKGRPRLKGARLPALEQRVRDRKTTWQRVTIRNWCGEVRPTIEIVSGTAVRYPTGLTPSPVRQAAWYVKRLPTFSDALALVRHQLWQNTSSHLSLPGTDMVKVPRFLLNR